MDESSGTGPVLVNNRITIDGVVVPKWLAIIVCAVAVLGLLAMVQNARTIDRLDRVADSVVSLPEVVDGLEKRAEETELNIGLAKASTAQCSRDIETWIRWSSAVYIFLEARGIQVPPLPPGYQKEEEETHPTTGEDE